MSSYADVHDCILPVRHAGTKNFNGMLVYLGICNDAVSFSYNISQTVNKVLFIINLFRYSDWYNILKYFQRFRDHNNLIKTRWRDVATWNIEDLCKHQCAMQVIKSCLYKNGMLYNNN